MTTLPPSTRQHHPKRTSSGVVSCRFACLSLIFFALGIAGARSAHEMAKGLEIAVPSPSASGYAQPWQVPWFHWNVYLGLKIVGVFCLIAGIVCIVATMISGLRSLLQARRAMLQSAKNLAPMALLVASLSLLLATLNTLFVFMSLLDFFMWGFSF